MPTPPTAPSILQRFAVLALVVLILAGLLTTVFGIYAWATTGSALSGVSLIAAGVVVALFGLLFYSQVFLLRKFVNYSYRAYEALLASAELQRQTEEQIRIIAENSSLSEWAKRLVYREKDFEFLREQIHSAIIKQDWDAAQHLIRSVDTEFGYHEEAARFREDLERARKATTEERITAVLARFDKLCDEEKWEQALKDCKRLQALFPEDPRIAALPGEIEIRRQEHKQKLLQDYEEAVRNEDIERAHRLLFSLDLYLVPKEAEALKESARTVFRARLEQIKTRFTIAVSYKQFHNAIAAGEQILREFPNSGYAHEIAKLMPVLRERAKKQSPHHAPVPARIDHS